MDCYILVRVSGDEVDVEVRPVGALSSGNYSPQRWAEVYDYQSRYTIVFEKVMRRYPVLALVIMAIVGLTIGVLLPRLFRRQKQVTASES